MDEKILWEKCVAFHGHECGGLVIGFKAALYAGKLLNFGFSANEDLVCIAENDACGIDAIQVILGCSLGKGNLLFHITGKHAYSFYHRESGKSLRLVLKPLPAAMTRAESFDYYRQQQPEAMFEVKDTALTLPQKAQIFDAYACDNCGEVTGSHWLRLQGEKKLCLDCWEAYDRFQV